MSPTDSHIDVRQHPEAVELQLEPNDQPDLPRRMPNNLPRPKFVDPEGSISSKYLNIVEKEDNHIFESVSETADKTVIFVGLFSAAVAVLVAVSIQDLRPAPQFYLANIYQLLAEHNVSYAPTPSALANQPTFSPPTYAIWVNSLWFLSLSISLVCGLLATSQQHWIRSYIMVTQAPQIPPRRRARIHAFRYRGIMNSGFFMAFDITGTLIHTSLFLFFTGLLIYLFNINFTLFCAVVWFLGASAMAYVIIALMPVCRIDSPYGSPLSFLLYWPFAGILYAILRILNSLIRAGNTASERLHHLKTICSEGFASAFLRSALKPSLDIECQIMDRTIDIMDEPELEWAFERFCDLSSSSVFSDTQRPLAKIHEPKWSSALEAFSDSTLSSDSLSESDKIRRLGLCMKVADLAQTPNVGLHILGRIFDGQNPVLQSIEMDDILRRWNGCNQENSFCTQILVSGIIANVRSRDDRWIALASDLLGKSEVEVRGYRDRGDGNVLLANLIHITRRIIRFWKNEQGEAHDAFTNIFRSLSNFDTRNTLPELKDDFLTLWKEIDHTEIRDELRSLCNVLTQGRDNALTAPPFPDSNSPGHPSGLISLPPHPPSPVTNHPAAEPADRLPPGGISDAIHNIAQTSVSPHSAPMLPERHGLSSISHVTDKVSTRTAGKTWRRAIVTPGNTPDISSNGQSALRHEPNGSLPPVDGISSTDVGIGPESLPPALTSISSSAMPQAVSNLPNGTSTAPLGAYHGAQDQSGPSAEKRDRSVKSA